MELPRVPNEQPTKTAMKAYLVLMQEDEVWHKEILNIQKEHKNVLFSLTNKGPVEGMHEDPIDVLKRELQYEKQFKNSAPKEEAKVVELGDGAAKEVTAEEAKKSYGKFSFLGSEDAQKNLVQEFLNRNKKKKEEAEAQAEQNDEAKVEEVANDENNDKKNENDDNKDENGEKEEAKEAAPEPENKESTEDNAPLVEEQNNDAEVRFFTLILFRIMLKNNQKMIKQMMLKRAKKLKKLKVIKIQ